MNRSYITRTDEEIARCFAVMAELRPHLREEEFVARVRRQQVDGYQLAALEAEGRVRSVAGFRIAEYLAWGKTLYVDDLVTTASDRSRGFGKAIFAWLCEQASSQSCAQLHLDSGVQRFAAHRFYLSQRMDITSHHFALVLPSPRPGT